MGYSDHYPIMALGRLVAVDLMVGGIAVLGVVTASVASWLVEQVRTNTAQEVQQADASLEVRFAELTAPLNERFPDGRPAAGEGRLKWTQSRRDPSNCDPFRDFLAGPAGSELCWGHEGLYTRGGRMPENLIDELPAGLDAAVNELLSPGEIIHVKLKGAYKEALVCTDRRVLIVKKGFMTGQTLGANSFQQSYQSIAGAQVKFGALSGYFEVSSGGMQNTSKSYWSNKKGDDPKQAPNCVSLSSKKDTERFREAVAFIMEHIHSLSAPAPVAAAPSAQDSSDAIMASIKKLSELHEAGILTDDEFGAKKAELLARL